ncbi:MAG: ABC transporter ATP-binding protein [Oscillospiraceae bacterium]|nr:ABC transporter ATP-binding protein [Oscillospiraceae bacterium]
MRKFFGYFKPYIGTYIVLMILLIIRALSELFLPSLNKDIINNGILPLDIDYIWRIGGVMLAVTLLLGVVSVIINLISARISMSFGKDLRKAIFSKVESFSLNELEQIGVPSLITRTTNDVQQIQQAGFMFMRIMVSAPIMAVGGVILAVQQDAPLSLALAVIIPLIVGIIIILMKKGFPLFKQVQKKTDRLNLVLREKLSGVRVIRAFVKNAYEEARFETANLDLTQTSLSVHRMMVFLMPSIMLLMNTAALFIYWFGAQRIDSGEMQIGNLTAFLAYIMLILFAVMMASMLFIMLPRALASAERINAVLEMESSVTDPNEADQADYHPPFSSLRFEDVSFRYPGAEEAILENVSFEVRPGETVAILGSTGCGKSTLVNLIPRFYDVSGGSIRINDTDIRHFSLKVLYDLIGFVPQKAFLFRGSIADNLRYGKEDASDEELWEALRIAQAEDFVREMPDRELSEITQGGSNVSGGQRQRLSIARALIKNPAVYIFDDSFSALDYKTDAALRKALREKTTGSAVLIVAQRVSTVLHADRIIVLENGRIEGIGSHEELMKTCAVYKEIVLSQVSQEEIS